MQRVDGAAKDADFGIELAEIEIVAGELRGDEQADVFKVGGVGLIGGFGGFDAAAASAKMIDLVADREGNLEGVLLDWRSVTGTTLVGRLPERRWRSTLGAPGEGRKQRGDLDRGGGARLFEMRDAET